MVPPRDLDSPRPDRARTCDRSERRSCIRKAVLEVGDYLVEMGDDVPDLVSRPSDRLVELAFAVEHDVVCFRVRRCHAPDSDRLVKRKRFVAVVGHVLSPSWDSLDSGLVTRRSARSPVTNRAAGVLLCSLTAPCGPFPPKSSGHRGGSLCLSGGSPSLFSTTQWHVVTQCLFRGGHGRSWAAAVAGAAVASTARPNSAAIVLFMVPSRDSLGGHH